MYASYPSPWASWAALFLPSFFSFLSPASPSLIFTLVNAAIESIITINMSYLLIKNNGRAKSTAPQQRNGRRNPSLPLSRVGGSGPSWRNGNGATSSSSSSLQQQQRPGGASSSFTRSSDGMRGSIGGGVVGAPNKAGMNGNAGNNGDGTVVNDGGGQIQLQRPAVVAQQQQQQQQQNQQHDRNLQQGIVSMDDGEFNIRILLGGGDDGLSLALALVLRRFIC
jgi:hypothetical protein